MRKFRIQNSKLEVEKLLPGLKRNILLASYTTFKIGGVAKYFFIAKQKEDIALAISWAKKNNLPFFILGGGGSTLVADTGYKGLVIKIQNSEFRVQNSNIVAEAGATLNRLSKLAQENSLSGLEWAVGIPGTLGGAIWGNCGAFGESISDKVQEVKVFDSHEEGIKILKRKDCKFSYRTSIFKKKKNFIILSAKLGLKKGNKKEIEEKIKKNIEYRKRTQPQLPSAGSIFRNPKGFFAAKLIEDCGLKGRKIGKAKISDKHANFILNLGGATSKDIKKLIKLVKKKVENNFAIELEEEICYLN